MTVMRIPEAELEDIKRSVSLEQLCLQRGIKLERQSSRNLKGKCPFHNDTEASFIITPDKNLFNCFGCNAGGSNIDFIMKIEGVSFRHAVEILKNDPSATGGGLAIKKATVNKLSTPFIVDTADNELLKQITEFYHESLFKNNKALEYLQRRGFRSHEMLKHFKIGYSNRALGYRLPHKNRKAGDEIRTRLTKLGIYRETGHEHFSGCITFPVFSNKGNITEIYGRRIFTGRNNCKHLYLPGPHTGVWNESSISDKKEWIICESIIDALSFYNSGFYNVTASYGARGFSPDHLKLIKSSNVESVVIAYDNDDAGNTASNELAQKLAPFNIKTFTLELPPGSDINELTARNEDAETLLISLMASKKPMFPEQAEPVFVASQPVSETKQTKEEEKTPTAESGFEVAEGQLEFTRGKRSYRVRGLDNNSSFEHLKINMRLKVVHKFHIDTFDLYNARQRTAFTAAAVQVTGIERKVIEEDISILLARIEEEQEKRILNKMKIDTKLPVMTPEDEQNALALLKDPKLFERILADFHTVGTVGEESNKLIGYLVAVSRKLDDPLSAVIMSRSAAGKSSLLNAVLDFVPEEEKEVMTSMTAQALFYIPEDGLKHKVLALAEDEGSEKATYPLKILQSEKVLVLAVTVKDQESGTMQTQQKKVDGPVAQFMTSTQAELDYEIANRYLVLTVDENREQTERIHEAQREAETLSGLLKRTEREETLRIHHNAQRLLRPLHVVNPFAKHLTFPSDKLRLRRDHRKYLGLIRTVAFMRQFQKKIKSCEHRGKVIQYIEVDETDLRISHPLAVHLLGRCLDELAPPVRSFLMEIYSAVKKLAEEREVKPSLVNLTQREMREITGWSDTQVRRYLERLIQMEYIIQHRVPGTGSRYVYELLYDGQGKEGKMFLPFLKDIDSLFEKIRLYPKV